MAGKNRFTDSAWQEIASIVSSSFAMEPARAEKLKTNVTAKLIAAIPFLADCREPQRTAIAHLSTYVVASDGPGRKAFDHKAGDDYDSLARLAPIAGFEGGDPSIINRGMKLLAMIMIQGYQRDLASDKAKGLYNPINAGAWKAEEKLASLRSAVTAVPDEEMDAIVSAKATPAALASLSGNISVQTWWGIG
jgi:hypothetical protein